MSPIESRYVHVTFARMTRLIETAGKGARLTFDPRLGRMRLAWGHTVYITRLFGVPA
jgi:hypothetical protein